MPNTQDGPLLDALLDRIAEMLNDSAKVVRDAVRPLDDEEIGQVTWDLWMDKGKWS